ncbi:MAG: hypothetical protein WA962_11720 [Ornithinimicrobium sp.]
MRPADNSSPRDDRRAAVLDVLKAASRPLSIKDLAEQVDAHPNTVRFHLMSLRADWRVEQVNSTPRAAGRPPQLFRSVPGMDPSGPRGYQELAEVLVAELADRPDPTARALEAGRSWGRQQATDRLPSADETSGAADEPVTTLVSLLDDLGFAPQVHDAGDRATISLRHCPFLELTDTRSAIICSIHLGLMQGALHAWGADVDVDRLDPFVEPDRCLAHLSTKGAS